MRDVPPVLIHFLLHWFFCGPFCSLHLRDTITLRTEDTILFRNLLKLNPATLAFLICRLKVHGCCSGYYQWPRRVLLAPQSGAFRINAYRDFQSNPIPSTYSFWAFKPLYGDLKQSKQTKADQCRLFGVIIKLLDMEMLRASCMYV